MCRERLRLLCHRVDMEQKSTRRIGRLFLGAGGLSAFLALLCCGFSWILLGLFATLGLSFLLQDSVLVTVIIFGLIVAFIGWRMLKR